MYINRQEIRDVWNKMQGNWGFLRTIHTDKNVEEDLKCFIEEIWYHYEELRFACEKEDKDKYKENSRELAESIIALKSCVTLRCDHTDMVFVVHVLNWLDELMDVLKTLSSVLEFPLL